MLSSSTFPPVTRYFRARRLTGPAHALLVELLPDVEAARTVDGGVEHLVERPGERDVLARPAVRARREQPRNRGPPVRCDCARGGTGLCR